MCQSMVTYLSMTAMLTAAKYTRIHDCPRCGLLPSYFSYVFMMM